MQSLFAGVSGLRSHQRRMDVIGNNVANVNTVGFKAARATFQDVLYNTLRGAGAPQNNRGGTNPMQVGLGVQVGSIDTLFTSGNPQSTGVETDLMIQGEGLFVVSDGERFYYTRAGNFYPDSDGTLVTPGGYKVMGWRADPQTGQIDTFAPIGELRIEKGSVIHARATTEVVLSGNLDPSQGDSRTPARVIYDSLGNAHEIYFRFVPSGTPNVWNVTAYWNNPMSDPPDTPVGWVQVEFNENGQFSSGGPLTANLNVGGGATTPLSVTVDLSGLTQLAGETTVKIASQDGFPMGTLERFAFDSNGVITGYYSNGLRQVLGQVALALFANPGGLERLGESLFIETPNSGAAQIGAANTGGRGGILPSTLEMSNVDLAQEFTEMILTQRGYQANSRVITTSDEMLQELVNLKR